MCGEQGDGNTPGLTHPGSSPRVRGTANGRDQAEAMPGIIPARAGSSRPIRTSGCAIWGHPRACGEQSRFRSSAPLRSGSSPRVRGAGRHYPQADQPQGIIPACAGSRIPCTPRSRGGRDHPRVCGEQWVSIDYGITNPGSFPRMRGAVDRDVVLAVVLGIIPARAGSSASWRSSPGCTGDHPRACGEQVRLAAVVDLGHGIIPARAGSRAARAASGLG